jgi:hypothetical protein
MDFVARALSRLAFVAGIAGATAMAQLIPRYADVGQIDFLRGLQALIEGWRTLAASIGSTLGRLPLVPSLSGEVITVLLFGSFLAIPTAIMLATSWPPERLAAYDFAEYRRQMGAQRGAWAAIVKTVQAIGLVFIFLSLYADVVAPDLIRRISSGAATSGTGPFALIFATFMVGVAYLFALAQLKGYFTGLIIVLAAIITAQALYWLDAPWISDQLGALAETTVTPAQSQTSDEANASMMCA